MCCMKATGMSIAYIKNYIDLCTKENDTFSERREIILYQKKAIKEQLKKYNDIFKFLDAKLDYYDKKISKDELKKMITEELNN